MLLTLFSKLALIWKKREERGRRGRRTICIVAIVIG